ncbi:MAG: SixA phosphatase family protein [Thermoanaerobaculia bacterium]
MPDQNPESTEPQTAAPESEPEQPAEPARKVKAKPAPRRRPATRAMKKNASTGAAAKTVRPASKPGVSRFVVLFRHGLAEDHGVDKPDSDRSLTADGHAKTRRAARGMQEIFSEADTLFASPLLRSMQTALWLTKAYREKLKIQVTETLVPTADPARLVELIASQDGRNVIVVGHEPHLTDAFAHLLGLPGSTRADLKKAGAIGIRLDERGRGTLEWMLTPKMLRRLG